MNVVRAFAPGRVNLIGDHTDYTGGLVLPMAVQLGTTVEVERRGDIVELRSDSEPQPAHVPLDVTEPMDVRPRWARYVAGIVAELRPRTGAVGTVTTTVPIGAGLSSSAALLVGVALALGFEGDSLELALLCQRAEVAASGVPVGVMDQLVSAAGMNGQALLIDCAALTYHGVKLPEEVEIFAVHSGEQRSLAGSGYAQRRAEAAAAERIVGPLRSATFADADRIGDPLLRRRARHIVSENERTRAFADAIATGDLTAAGALMAQSHASLRDDYEVSTPTVDQLVEQLAAQRGVIGARMTGGGFGGAVVVMAHAGTEVGGWRLVPSDGARRWSDDDEEPR